MEKQLRWFGTCAEEGYRIHWTKDVEVGKRGRPRIRFVDVVKTER